mmetsp:Transcript_12113/g.19718  ORF Transcript_12113/g.19718 Transcript_12113/m.19718 type:complete len:457 (-) Transcript_12113:108-1478(-)|eukprot:CAMPEP_0203753960 /NCGR_PEP_ID=MMETSP0098-20131031/7638_1 /ASSEMBLY_ACC=CAM_ASM_000208 /TAXON_ID=96639 /ORGANISM=" , Strain NY0313808BC1" /LENGTH=456 /DNA_ID=CAMNT_0050644783 /DNA_START=230 /DNA_END=1600 /DNA_ORIENTATION=-
MPSPTPTLEEVVQTRAKSMGLELLSLQDAQKEMNEKLMSGWIMMNETCPISNYPLVKDPKTGAVWSIRCQAPITNKAPENATSQPPGRDCVGEVAADSFADAETQSQRIADKLVQGWVLTSDVCPVSQNCPLLLDKSTKKKWSAAIGDYIPEDKEPEPVVAPVVQKESDRKKGQTDEGLFAVNTISKNIGDRLMQGWTMLAEECPVTHRCPLMQDPKTKRKYSAALDRFIDENNGGKDENKPLNQPETAETTPPVVPAKVRDTKISINNVDSTDDISKRIGDLLLKGWTMLDEECPVTHACPLMQDPSTKRKFSAALNRFTDEPTPVVSNKAAAAKVEDDPGQYHFGSWKDTAKESAKKDLKGIDEEKEESYNSDGDNLSTKSVLSGVSVNGNTVKELDRAEATIRSKLRECCSALAGHELTSSSSVPDVQVCAELVKMLTLCTEGLETVQRARKK